MAFPCNQFGNQEPGTNAEIKAFAGRSFEDALRQGRRSKPDARRAWKFLEASNVGGGEGSIPIDFAKFLVGRDGVPVKKYGAPFDAKAIERGVGQLLGRIETGGRRRGIPSS